MLDAYIAEKLSSSLPMALAHRLRLVHTLSVLYDRLPGELITSSANAHVRAGRNRLTHRISPAGKPRS